MITRQSNTVGGKRHLREFDIEELLFRKPLVVSDERQMFITRIKSFLLRVVVDPLALNFADS